MVGNYKNEMQQFEWSCNIDIVDSIFGSVCPVQKGTSDHHTANAHNLKVLK